MKKYRFALNLQLFSDGMEESGVENNVPAAEEQTVPAPDSQTGVETEGAAEPEKQNNFEKAFAKRLAAEREKWEKDYQERYKHHDDYRKAAEYLQKTTGYEDILSLKEQIELAELQEQADSQSVPVEVLKRIQELEAKAAKADAFEQQQAEERTRGEFESSLKTFAEGKMLGDKALDYRELWQYMADNQTSSPEVAYKAMKADVLEQQIANAEKEGVKKFLAAKGSIPNVTGNTSQGATPQQPPKTLAEARQRALARMTFTE